MKTILIGCILTVIALTAGSSRLAALGALAVGTTGDIPSDGVAIGGSYGKATSQEAAAVALQDCRNHPDIPKSVARCKIVGTLKNQCYAVAFDPMVGTPGAGWAIAPTREAAGKQAMANCQATAGESRRKYCQITDIWACDHAH